LTFTPARDLPPGGEVDTPSAVNAASPPTDGKAVSRLLDHVRASGLTEARPRARERLEAVLGGELAHRLVGALAGDHRVPARLFVD
jgi:hypothetical protein